MCHNKWSYLNVCVFDSPRGIFQIFFQFWTHLTMEDMVGKWKLEKRDPNFEEFLVCRQVDKTILGSHQKKQQQKLDIQVTGLQKNWHAPEGRWGLLFVNELGKFGNSYWSDIRLVGSCANWWPAPLWTPSTSSMRIGPLLPRCLVPRWNLCLTTYLLRQVTSNMARSTEYPMPTQGEFFPKRSLSGREEVCCSNELWWFLWALVTGG